jgi:hypothetical protein
MLVVEEEDRMLDLQEEVVVLVVAVLVEQLMLVEETAHLELLVWVVEEVDQVHNLVRLKVGEMVDLVALVSLF